MDVIKNGVCFKVLSDTRRRWIWNHILNNFWEEGTFKVFDYFLEPDKSYLDIGVWIGPTALYCACKAKHVYAVEPDNGAFQELARNLELNSSLIPKVTCVNAALTEQSGVVRLYTRTEPGDSLSSVIPNAFL
ncbi:FkbM family methyltransferase [Desulfosporosinus lacus]|uniref:FkbM family methyltransferase n=1 Tax=Desulfosporosinus lacus TaxID=329936 RepID=UPI000A059123|nr:FkbM family methyltransferase [Desulfosporosinus lacus]